MIGQYTIPETATFSVGDLPRKWVPKIKAGFFYVNEKRYYLYDKKVSCYLNELKWTRIRLADILEESTLTVYFNGYKVDNRYYRLNGPYIEINHSSLTNPGTHMRSLHLDFSVIDPTFFDETVSVRVVGTCYVPSEDSEYTETAVDQTVFLSDGEVFYEFPIEPNKNAPIVITDDTIYPYDRRQISPEFAVDGRALTFNAIKSIFANHDFSAGLKHWAYSGTAAITTDNDYFGEVEAFPYCSPYFIDLDGTLSQIARVSPDSFYSLSVVTRAATNAEVDVNITFYDGSWSVLSTGTETLNLTQRDDWVKYDYTIGRANAIRSYDYSIPANASYIKIEIDGECEVGLCSLYNSRYPTDCYYPSGLSTVEYEIGDGEWYTHHRLITWNPDGTVDANQYAQDSVDLNPMYSVNTNGFLFLYDCDNISDFQLGLGGITQTQPTSLSKGRRHVPYAKVSGIGKLTQVGILGLSNPKWTEEIEEVVAAPEVVDIDIVAPGHIITTATGTISGTLTPGVTQEVTSSSAIVTADSGWCKVKGNRYTYTRVNGFTVRLGTKLLAQTDADNTMYLYQDWVIVDPTGNTVVCVAYDQNGAPVGDKEIDVNITTITGTVDVEINQPNTDSDGAVNLTIGGVSGGRARVTVDIDGYERTFSVAVN